MKEIKIGGRTIPLLYTTYELIEIQEEIGCTGYQLRDEVFGIRLENEDDPTSIVFDCVKDGRKTKNLGKLIRILGNAGLEESGQEPDLTDRWVLKNIKPGLIIMFALIMWTVINEGNSIEAPKAAEGQEAVDEGLEEEIEKKPQGK